MIKSDLVTLVKSAFPGAAAFLVEELTTSCYLNTNEGWVGEFKDSYSDEVSKYKLTVNFNAGNAELYITGDSYSQIWAIVQHEIWKRGIIKNENDKQQEKEQVYEEEKI